MKSVLISAIVPVYNTPIKILDNCLNSILKQTYKNFELICVNDGSTTLIKDYLNKFAEKDKRISIIHKKNEGVSKARNCGINRANGQYICFIDSDDLIERTFFEQGIKCFELDVDLVIGKVNWIENNKVIKSNYDYDSENLDKTIINIKENKENILKQFLLWPESQDKFKQGFQAEIWGKLFKKSKMNKIEFDTNVEIGEDQLFMIDYIMNCKTICVVNSIWYNYTIWSNSSIHRRDEKKVYKYINFFEAVCRKIPIEMSNNILPLKAFFCLREFLGMIQIPWWDIKNYGFIFRNFKIFCSNRYVSFYLGKINRKKIYLIIRDGFRKF